MKKIISRKFYSILAMQAHDSSAIIRKARAMQNSDMEPQEILDFIFNEFTDLEIRKEKVSKEWDIIQKFVENADEDGYVRYMCDKHPVLSSDAVYESILRQDFKHFLGV